MTAPVVFSSLNNDYGLSIFGQNKLYTMQLEAQPSHLDKSYVKNDRSIQMVPYDMNKQIVVAKTIAYGTELPTFEEVEVAQQMLASVHRMEKKNASSEISHNKGGVPSCFRGTSFLT